MNGSLEIIVRDLRSTLATMELGIGVIQEAICWTNELGQIQWCNKAFDSYSEKLHIEVLGDTFSKLIPLSKDNDIVNWDNHPIKVTCATQKPFFDYFDTNQNRKIFLSSQYLSISRKNPICVIVMRDITKEHHQFSEILSKEKALEEKTQSLVRQKKYIDSIVSSMTNMLFVLNLNLVIQTVNQATIKTLGYSTKELIDQSLMPLLIHDRAETNLMNILNANLSKGYIPTCETTLVSKNKKKIPVLFSGAVLKSHTDQSIEIVCLAQDITERKKSENKLKKMAHYDVLTGLPNRLQYMEKLRYQIHIAEQNQYEKFALLLIDLDSFKSVNDRLGHPIGDALLAAAGKRLNAQTRKSDFVARIGGDEFSVIVTNFNNKESLNLLSIKLVKILGQPYSLSGNEIIIGASIGIVVYPDYGDDADTLVRNADAALYYAKASGRNQYQYYTKGLASKIHRRLFIENELRFALARNELYLVYQPIYQISSRKISRVEVLLRWNNKNIGNISPEEFIPIAESIGIMQNIGDWVLFTALKIYSAWYVTINNKIKICLNISAIQIERAGFVSHITAVCNELQIPAAMVELELTESSVMHNPGKTIDILRQLKRNGFSISIDDFGTGYSSLMYLQELPADTIKIDKSFIQNINESGKNFIINFIIMLSKSLGLTIIAEGVETKKQLDCLIKNKCDQAQGYYLSKPLLKTDFTALIEKR